LAQGTDDNHAYTNGAQQFYFKTRSNQFAWQNRLKIADGQHLNVAIEHLGQTVSSDTPYTQTRRNLNSLLGGYVANYGTQQVQLNLRQDHYSDFDTVNTGLLGYGWQFSGAWRATAAIGNAFKAPTFLDMYAPPAWGGNPNLRPERAKNMEAALHYAADGQYLDVVYFDNRIRELIAYQFPLTVNINKARIDGWELGYAGEFGDTRIKANLTMQNPRDTATGQILPRRAREHANFAVMQEFGAWNAGAELHHSGARKNSNFDNFVLPAYQLVNLTAAYRIDAHLNLSARVDNLFDRTYSEAYSFNTPGRRLFVGLSYRQ
jgi:vitamin B12 transporter